MVPVGHLNLEIDVERLVGVDQMFPELLIQIFGDSDVLEHPLQLGRVLEPAGLLQLRDHGGLGVVAGRHVLHESLGQHLAVELLENVLVLDVLENDHLK